MTEGCRADLHTHFLPKMDDGSKSSEESVEMLECFKSQGVRDIIATPHFYIRDNGVESFLKRREASFERLTTRYNFDGRLLLGAEVYYAKDLYRVESFEKLSLGNSGFILIELPYIPKIEKDWLEDLEDMTEETGLTIVFAHIERFLDKLTWTAKRKLYSMDAVFQINLPSLVDEKHRKLIYKFLKKNKFTVLGSDSHNMQERNPMFYSRGIEILKRDLGEEAVDRLLKNTKYIFDEIAKY